MTSQGLKAPAMIPTPTYKRMLPTYNGFRTYEKGPATTSEGAPTAPVTLVSGPAYATPQKRVNSPIAMTRTPMKKAGRTGCAKTTITRRNGIGV